MPGQAVGEPLAESAAYRAYILTAQFKWLTTLHLLMMDYLLVTCLLLLTIGHALLVWGCLDWRRHRHTLTGEMTERADGFTSLIVDLGGVLEDIADILDSGSGGDTGNVLNAPIPGAGDSIGNMLSSMLMSRVIDGITDGTKQSGQIQESLTKAQNEIGNQPDEHG